MGNKETIRKRKYDDVYSRFYRLKLNRKTDADIIAKLATVPSMQGYIRRLIRDDLARNNNIIPEE